VAERPGLAAFSTPGRFWRGGLHAHSDRSDGALSPAAVVEQYRHAGYDFVAVTDHFRAVYGFPVTDTRALRSDGFTTLIGAELHAPDPELSAEWHLIAAGLPLDFAPLRPGETGPQLARRARQAGAFLGIAHPAASLLTLADADRVDAAHAVETHNVLAGREDRADSWHFYDALLARGRRLSAYAADDAHFQPGDPPGCRSWVQVRAAALDPADLVAALIRGAYYSSTGPEIAAVDLDGDEVHVVCSPATRVILTGGLPGCQLVTGEGLTRVAIPLGFLADASHVRVTVVDAAGERAWTNPLWVT
jgi:PHP domain